MNVSLVTTGLVPLVKGSMETFEGSPSLNGLPWDLTGGTGILKIRDPMGQVTTLGAVVGNGKVVSSWTVAGLSGTWTRAWLLTDATGLTQVSQPIVFTVTDAP